MESNAFLHVSNAILVFVSVLLYFQRQKARNSFVKLDLFFRLLVLNLTPDSRIALKKVAEAVMIAKRCSIPLDEMQEIEKAAKSFSKECKEKLIHQAEETSDENPKVSSGF